MEDELEAGGEGEAADASAVAGSGFASAFRAAFAEERNERCTGWRGEAGGRKCRLWVTVFVDGVRESTGAAVLGVPGILASARGKGLSLDRTESEEGARDAPPLPSLFIAIPPRAGCWLAVPASGTGAFELRSLFICALTFLKCRSYSQAACCRRKGCDTPKSWALKDFSSACTCDQ